MNETFSDELRLKSKNIHDKSDKLVNLKLAIALTDLKLYGLVLKDFYHIFKTIEDQVAKHQTNEKIAELWMPELSRKEAFEKDLEYYLGINWCQFEPSKVVNDYVSHIYTVTDDEPELLIAYIHTMYLAILSGGYIIKKLVIRTLGIDGSHGISSLEIPSNVSRLELKNHIKNCINKMELDRSLKDRIIQEKIWIFKQNNAIVSCVKPTLKSGARLFKLCFMFLILILLFWYAFMLY